MPLKLGRRIEAGPSKSPEIQGLRGFAVIIVVDCHGVFGQWALLKWG